MLGHHTGSYPHFKMRHLRCQYLTPRINGLGPQMWGHLGQGREMIWSLKGKSGGEGTKGSSKEPGSCQSTAVQHGPGKESLPHYQQMSLPKDVARQRGGRCPPSLFPQGTQKQNRNGDTKFPAQSSVQLHTLLGCDSHTKPTRGSEVK